MTNFIPIFPLEIVVYPGEALNLHIFEPRYKELINECHTNKKPFGIPPVFNKHIEEYGTLMEITEIVKVYENGEMDIKTRGTEIFRILHIVQEIPEKLYSGAVVSYPSNVMEQGESELANKVFGEVKRLYELLGVSEKFPEKKTSMVSYEIAHFVGLTKVQEYELLNIFTEIQRLEYLRRHLKTIAPVIEGLEQMKARVKMNGHFKNLSIDDLNI
ncbi:MAG: peptidase S16 [Sphingobacteriales bacterium]|nr:MAG: peptidase S16 [Sphingobacteriales bacterium]